MSATIKDIARETGLSLATVSSCLNGGNVREKNRIKIEEAVKKYDFQINESARSLRSKRSMTVGFVIPEFGNICSAEIFSGIADRLQMMGYGILTSVCRNDSKLEKEAVDFLTKKRVDAIINIPVTTDGSHLLSFLKTGKPLILIDRKIRNLDCNYVLVDNVDAVFRAVNKLLKNGHSKIGLIGGPVGVYTAEERTAGYNLAMLEAGLIPDAGLIERCDYTISAGCKSMKRLLKQNPDMTAVIAVNYETTVGAIIALNESDKKMGEDISLIGFDNVAFAKACRPQLEIVTQPVQSIVDSTLGILVPLLTGKSSGTKTVMLKTEVLEGNSIKSLT